MYDMVRLRPFWPDVSVSCVITVWHHVVIGGVYGVFMSDFIFMLICVIDLALLAGAARCAAGLCPAPGRLQRTPHACHVSVIDHVSVPGLHAGDHADVLLVHVPRRQHQYGAAQGRITSHHITSHHITSHHITSHHITSHHITSHHITTHSIAAWSQPSSSNPSSTTPNKKLACESALTHRRCRPTHCRHHRHLCLSRLAVESPDVVLIVESI